MNNITDKVAVCSSCSEEEISLHDLWKKLVEYKKIFWVVFFVVFAFGSVKVFLTAPNYTFTQAIEVGKYINDSGVFLREPEVGKAATMVNKILFPRAVRNYNLQAKGKSELNIKKMKKSNPIAEDFGGGIMFLSVKAPLAHADGYKVVFREILNSLFDEPNKYLETRRKNLSNSKTKSERYLDTMIGSMVGSGNVRDHVEKNLNYVQKIVVYDLINKIDEIQMRIESCKNAKELSAFTVSEEFIGPSRLVLLILTVMVSLFLAFFSVFVANFIIGQRNNFRSK
jgi:hypothetical protein